MRLKLLQDGLIAPVMIDRVTTESEFCVFQIHTCRHFKESALYIAESWYSEACL